jgi:hypothetical protein
MLGPAVIRAAELLAVVLAAGTVALAAGLWWLRRRVRRLKRLGRAAAQPAARRLAEDARREAQALAAGIAAAGLAGDRT